MTRLTLALTLLLAAPVFAQEDPVLIAVPDHLVPKPGQLLVFYTVTVDGVTMLDAEGNPRMFDQHVPVYSIDVYEAAGESNDQA